MKTASLALALLGAVSATPVAVRQTTTGFDVTGFSASCTPHSSLCFFDLSVQVSPTSAAIECSATAYSYQVLLQLPPTACKNPSVTFSYTFVEGGADLTLNWGYETGRNLTGTHFVPAEEIVWINQQSPTGTVQAYAGPHDFVIGDLEAIAVL